jgi:hypothetical protein
MMGFAPGLFTGGKSKRGAQASDRRDGGTVLVLFDGSNTQRIRSMKFLSMEQKQKPTAQYLVVERR